MRTGYDDGDYEANVPLEHLRQTRAEPCDKPASPPDATALSYVWMHPRATSSAHDT